jgi:hypothetical protein
MKRKIYSIILLSFVLSGCNISINEEVYDYKTHTQPVVTKILKITTERSNKYKSKIADLNKEIEELKLIINSE